MAKMETANLIGMKFPHANICDVVGRGAKNERSDVLLIQAFLRLIGFNQDAAKYQLGLSLDKLPKPTGIFDNKTDAAIRGFQHRHISHILNLDGKVHPANYANRVIKNPGGRVMMITLLNMQAIDGALLAYNITNVFAALKLIAPDLVSVL